MAKPFTAAFLAYSEDEALARGVARASQNELFLDKLPLTHRADILLIDETRLHEINCLNDLHDSPKIIIGNKEKLKTMINTLGQQKTLGLILKNKLPPNYGLFSDIISWSNPKNKKSLPSNFLDSGSYGLESLLYKKELLEKLESQLLSWGFTQRIIDQLSISADELLMNAAFDAPVDHNFNPLYKKTNRREIVPITKPIILTIGFNGTTGVISVEDQWGSLNQKSLTKHLSILNDYKNYELNDNGGAGIGLSQTLNRGVSLVFKSQVGVYTQASIFFNKTDNHRDFQQQSQILITNIE